VEKEVGKEESDSFSYHQIKLWRNYSTNITAVGFERKDPLDDLIAKQKMEKLQKNKVKLEMSNGFVSIINQYS
jgi:hypothetical protein